MLIISDRVKESSLTTGSGAVVFDSAFGGFQSFQAGIGNGNTTYYCIENGVRWEVGQGVYTLSGDTLSRDVVFDSSASGAKINLEGVSTVFCTLPADKAIIKNEASGTYVVDISTLELNSSGIISNTLSNSGDAVFGNDVLVSGDLTVVGSLFGIDDISSSGDIVSSGFLTLIRPNGDTGNFFHAYKEDGTQQTAALHMDGNISPLWKLGLKTNPTSQTAPPTFAYVFAKDGSAGMVSNSDNYASISDGIGFTVYHDTNTVFRASSLTGVYIETTSSANPSLVVTGPPAPITDLQRWSLYDDTILSVIDSGGKIGVLNDNPLYELDVNGSGKMDELYLTSGIYFQDGTFQSTAGGGGGGGGGEATAVSGWADTTMTSRDNAVSGWADSTITDGDNAVSGWSDTTMTNRDNAISGWADSTMTTRDNAISGYFQPYIDNQDAAISGVAVYASGHNLQTITDNGTATNNAITINNDLFAVSGHMSGIDLTPLSGAVHPPHLEGRLFYDSDSHALTIYNDEADVSLQLGQEEYLRVRNNKAYTIPNGSGVYMDGSQGTHPTVDFAIASGENTSHVIGLATHDIESNSFGYISTYGIVRDLNTSMFSDGDEVYLSATASGTYTTTPPTAPNYEAAVGHVIRSHASNGTILSHSHKPRLGGNDVKNLGNISNSGIAFFSQVTDENAGILSTDSNFYYDSGNAQVVLGSGGFNLSSGSDSGILYRDGAGDVKADGPTWNGTNLTVDGTVDGRDVATDGTKLDGIEASADVTDEANVAATASVIANTAKVSNATHTGDVTGDTVLTIAPGAVDIAMLANGTDGELITWDAAGDPSTVAAGTATHVLTSNGAGVAPTFQAAAGGGGDVSKVGTPVDNQIGVWTGDGTIEGDAGLTYDGITLSAGILTATAPAITDTPLTVAGSVGQTADIATIGGVTIDASSNLTVDGKATVEGKLVINGAGNEIFSAYDVGSFSIFNFGGGTYTNHTTRLTLHAGYSKFEHAAGASALQIKATVGLEVWNAGTTQFFAANGSTPGAIETGQLTISSPDIPASASATGTAGTVSWDADYVYVCVATDTWKRVAIATW